jgi:nitrogen fixation protein
VGIFNGSVFNRAIFNTTDPVVVATQEVGGGGSKPWKQKWRQELIDLLEQPLEALEVPVSRKAVKKVLRKVEALESLPDDAPAIQVLRAEVERLVRYKPVPKAVEARKFNDDDEEEVIFLLLH